MIELRRVSKVYPNGTVALNKINLSVKQGEFVFITGSSGAGKTSLVKLLLCEEVASSGDVLVNGKNLKRLSKRQIPKYRRQIGVVFQDFRLIPSMNVFDNIAFAMRAVGRPYREIRKRVQAALEIVGLPDKRKVLVTELSGGEQQRVALARAIVNGPKVIIADEPTANLDAENAFKIMKLLDYINSTGITMLVVSHADNLVTYFGKRTIEIENGQIVRDTPASETAQEGDIPLSKASTVVDDKEDKDVAEAERAIVRRRAVRRVTETNGASEAEMVGPSLPKEEVPAGTKPAETKPVEGKHEHRDESAARHARPESGEEESQ